MANSSMTLRQLFAGLLQLPASCDLEIRNIVSDSREAGPGALFVALPGLRQDGRQFEADALARGAVAILRTGDSRPVLTENGAVVLEVPDVRLLLPQLAIRFFDDPCRDLSLIGVTGTNGKSSVTHFIAQLLTALGQPCGLIGTLGYGLAGQMRTASHTTPDTLRLFRELAQMRAQGAKAVAMEVSSHALDQNRVAGLQFSGAVFTNLTHDHLDYHGDMESYGRAKQQLFERPELGFAVVNLDDGFGRCLADEWTRQGPMLGYGLHEAASLRATEVVYHAQGIEAKIHYQGQVGTLRCSLLGDFNLSNVLAALGALLTLGHPLEVVLKCAENLRPVSGRMQPVSASAGPLVIVDYAHTPDALEQALLACQRHQPGQLWCVFGCGGDRDRFKRPLMAGTAARYSAQVIVTDDNPRTESPQQIVEDILAGMPVGARFQVLHDREQAIAEAIAQADDRDIVLIAGKGHETYQEVQGERRPFDDVVVAQRYLQQRAAQQVTS